jgi:hypothetical protein
MSIKALFIPWNESVFAFVEEVRRQTFKPVLHSAVCLLATPHSLACQQCLYVQQQVISVKGRRCPKVSLLNCSRTHFFPCHGNLLCHFLNNRHHFLTLLIKHSKNPAMNFRQTNIFSA